MNIFKKRNFIVVGLIALLFSIVIFGVYTSDYNILLTKPQEMLWIFLFIWSLYALFMISSAQKDEITDAIKAVSATFGLGIVVNVFYTGYFYATSIFIKHLLEIGTFISFLLFVVIMILSFSVLDDEQEAWL